MDIHYERKFIKDLAKIKDAQIARRIEAKIEEVHTIASAYNPQDKDDLPPISSMLKMQGYDTYYRIRVGNYWLGVGIEIQIDEATDTFTFMRCLHRKDIYKRFP